MKKYWCLFTIIISYLLTAAVVPAVRDLNSLEVHFLPHKLNSQVEFSFDKQDLNGYNGTDAIVFTVISPNGQTVYEKAILDDGNISKNWETGPRQRVKISFAALEKGIYIMKCNTASPDIHLLFDHAQATNTAWGFHSWAYRFSGNSGIKGYLLLPISKLGESQNQIMQFCTTAHSNIKNINISSLSGKKLIKNHSLPQVKKMTFHQLNLSRLPNENIYYLEAEKFTNLVRFIFPQYGDFMFFTDLKSAKKFNQLTPITGNFLQLATPKKYSHIALEKSKKFLLNFTTNNINKPYDFTLNLEGKKIRFTQDKNSILIDGLTNNFLSIDATKAPKGKLEIILADQKPNILLPKSGSVVNKKTNILWSIVNNAQEYTLNLAEVNSQKKLTIKTTKNYLTTANLTSGVWKANVIINKVKGDDIFFTVPKFSNSTLAFFYNFNPKKDITLKTAPQRISFNVDLLKLEQINFKSSYVTINDKKYPLSKLGKNLIGTNNKISFLPNFNKIVVYLFDKEGTLSKTSWGFFLNNSPQVSVFTHDNLGNIYCNKIPFYPVIYYGYLINKLPVEKLGFNTVLGNTLPNKKFLNNMLNRNLKLLDSGSVFQGIYSKPRNNKGAENDVKKAVTNNLLRHPARLGAWMDEMDVHRDAKYIENFLNLFGPKENGWRGVCSCNNALYKKMAQLGDFLMIDHYGFSKTIFSTDTATILGKKAAQNKPLISLVKGFSRSNPKLTGFIPGTQNIEYAAFATLRNHANGIGLYQCGEYRLEVYPQSWQDATNIYQKFSALTFAIYGKEVSNVLNVKSSTGEVLHRAMQIDQSLYIIAQNRSFNPALGEFTIKNPKVKSVKVCFENRQLPVVNGKFFDTFIGEGTHIYYVNLK